MRLRLSNRSAPAVSHIPRDTTRPLCTLICTTPDCQRIEANLEVGQTRRRCKQPPTYSSTRLSPAMGHTFLAANAAPMVFLGVASKILFMYLSTRQDFPARHSPHQYDAISKIRPIFQEATLMTANTADSLMYSSRCDLRSSLLSSLMHWMCARYGLNLPTLCCPRRTTLTSTFAITISDHVLVVQASDNPQIHLSFLRRMPCSTNFK